MNSPVARAKAMQNAQRFEALPRLWAGKRPRAYVSTALVGAAHGLLIVVSALLFRSAIANIGYPAGLPQLALLSLILGALALAAVCQWFAHVEAEKIGQGYAHALRVRMFRRILEAGGDADASRGAVLLRLSGDLTPLSQWAGKGVTQLAVAAASTTICLIGLLVIGPAIAIAVGAAITVAGSASLLVASRFGAATVETRRKRGRLANLAADRISKAGAIEKLGRKDIELRRLRRASRKVRDASVDRASPSGALRSLGALGGALASLAALAAGMFMSNGSTFNAEEVVAAIFVASALAPQVIAAGRSLEYWTAAKVAQRRQRALFAEFSSHRAEQGTPRNIKRAPFFAVSGVKTSKGTLNISLKRRSRLFVNVAPEEATHVAMMLAGETPLACGEIALRGALLADFPRSIRRRRIALYDPFLPMFRGSLRGNIAPDASAEISVDDVVCAFELESLIARLQDGLDSRADDVETAATRDEMARLALARTMLSEPAVLIANVDMARGVSKLLAEPPIFYRGAIVAVFSGEELSAKGRVANEGVPGSLLTGRV